MLAVSIPADWAVRTAPAVVDTLDEVSLVPAIDAGPTVEDPVCDGCSSYFAPPTVQVRVFPYEPVGMTPDEDCGDIQVEPYDDGHFVGRREIGGGCDASLDRVLASQPGAVTVDILFISWSADQAPQTPERQAELTRLFDTILSTVEWTGVAYDEALAPFATAPADASASAADPAAALPPVGTVDDTPSYIQLWPYPSFRDVPRLGVEPVRGSGCGASGDLGDVIPDGLWAGYLYPATDGTVEMDVACVYEGDAAAQVVADGTATIVDDRDPDFLVVNNNTRRRTLTDDVRYVLWGVPDDVGGVHAAGCRGHGRLRPRRQPPRPTVPSAGCASKVVRPTGSSSAATPASSSAVDRRGRSGHSRSRYRARVTRSTYETQSDQMRRHVGHGRRRYFGVAALCTSARVKL